MNDKKFNRRDFLKLSFANSVALYLGCHSARYSVLNAESKNLTVAGKSIRIMSFNIGNARGNTDDFLKILRKEHIMDNLDWIAKLIQLYEIDVACFNEIDFNSIRTYGIDQSEYIAKSIGYNHIIKERIFSIPSWLEVGNAVISRYPLRLNMHRQYGVGFKDRARHIFKSFDDFDVLLDNTQDGRKLNIVLTHLDHHNHKTRCAEVDHLHLHLLAKQQPFVLLGDLNDTPNSDCFQHLTQNNLIGNPYLGIPTYPADNPLYAIDHILVSTGLQIQNYHTVVMEASDHLPIIGDIIFE